MKILVLLGAPGAGKSTRAKVLCDMLGVVHVASGDLFREEVAQGTPLGKKAKRYMERGALVPDSVVIGMMQERLARPDAAAGVILDGFPRTRAQAEAFDASLARKGSRLTAAIYIGVREAELVRRLSGRWVCRANGHLFHATDGPPKVPGICDFDGSDLYQREDDKPETVRARLAQQLPPMFEVIDYYRDRGVLLTVDGEQAFEDVKDSLVRALGDCLQLNASVGRR